MIESYSYSCHVDVLVLVSPPPMPCSGADLTPVTIINQYELIRELGRGGMGVVYTARDRRLGRRVATMQCSHENVVIIYEVNSYEGMAFMVLELLDGFPLRQLMDELGAGDIIPASRVVELILPGHGEAECHPWWQPAIEHVNGHVTRPRARLVGEVG